MNYKFKYISIIFFTLNVLFCFYLIISYILVLKGLIALSPLHLVVFIIDLIYNLAYISYIIFMILKDRQHRKQCKNID